MLLNQDLEDFVSSPVMIILGTCNGARQPEIGRAVGAVIKPAEDRVDLIISGWQWPGTVVNVRDNGRLSVTFARPSDYVSYQLKGTASVIAATAEHLAKSVGYVDAIAAVLSELGLRREISNRWFINRDPVVLNLLIENVFVQTPGAQAGQVFRGNV